jgi:hypothetical protein
MPEQDAPYDPYIPSGQAPAAQQGTGNARTQALQAVSLVSDAFGDGTTMGMCGDLSWEMGERAAAQ